MKSDEKRASWTAGIEPALVRRVQPRNQAPIVLAIFIVAQILDAVFTYGGVTRLGVDVEMNVLLATAMRAIGPALTLATAKLVACGCGLFLYWTARHRTLAVAAGLYLGVAVVPWCIVLLW